MANSWYAYLGAGTDPLVPASYRRITIRPNCVCGPNVCAIYLSGETGSVPANPLTSNMITYISNALTTGSPQPTASGGGLKLFVYMKGGCG